MNSDPEQNSMPQEPVSASCNETSCDPLLIEEKMTQPEPAAVSEQTLLEKARGGDTYAYGDLYQRYQEPVYRYVYFRVGDTFEAEDLTETVFLKAWEALPTIRLEGFNFRAWVYRIAHNLVVDRHRTHKVNVPLSQLNELDDHQENPEIIYQKLESSRLLSDLISLLEPDLQQVLLLRFVAGLNHAETAAIMHRKEVHVRVLQHRALKRVKDLMTNVKASNERSHY